VDTDVSKHFFERLNIGYAGKKRINPGCCALPWCGAPRSPYKGVGQSLCTKHQSMLREYGGPARMDRLWTFNKKTTCDFCSKDPWQHPKVKEIEDDLIRDRVAWGMLIVDHIKPQKYNGGDRPENCQTLCLDCNQIKTTLACDSMPKSLYKDLNEYKQIKKKLKPHLDKLFG
jgi:5-methylcytosine-specific restriction endonuclease McrA